MPVLLDAYHTPDPVWLDNTQREYVLEAACKSKNSVMFDTDIARESKKVAAARISRAKIVCAMCPVKTQCLADALANHAETGIWGGKTPAERGIYPRKRSGKRKSA